MMNSLLIKQICTTHNQASINLASLNVYDNNFTEIYALIVKRLGLGLGLGTWDLGPGTWDLGPRTWDLGSRI